MRTILLLTTLLVGLTLFTHAQFHGRCGSFRYTINGKLLSAVKTNDGITIKTYYAIDPKKGYIWFWREISEPDSQQTDEFISMWARLTDLDSSCIENSTANPLELKIRLSQKQNYFFTTIYSQQKKGPSYRVHNNLMIPFKNQGTAISIMGKLKTELPSYKY